MDESKRIGGDVVVFMGGPKSGESMAVEIGKHELRFIVEESCDALLGRTPEIRAVYSRREAVLPSGTWEYFYEFVDYINV